MAVSSVNGGSVSVNLACIVNEAGAGWVRAIQADNGDGNEERRCWKERRRLKNPASLHVFPGSQKKVLEENSLNHLHNNAAACSISANRSPLGVWDGIHSTAPIVSDNDKVVKERPSVRRTPAPLIYSAAKKAFHFLCCQRQGCHLRMRVTSNLKTSTEAADTEHRLKASACWPLGSRGQQAGFHHYNGTTFALMLMSCESQLHHCESDCIVFSFSLKEWLMDEWMNEWPRSPPLNSTRQFLFVFQPMGLNLPLVSTAFMAQINIDLQTVSKTFSLNHGGGWSGTSSNCSPMADRWILNAD